MSMAEKLIEDFGEKIGGARKDLYALKPRTSLWRYYRLEFSGKRKIYN